MSSLFLADPQSAIAAALVVPACPLIWNIVARNEYRRHTLTKLTGSKLIGCYILAAWIFFFSLFRDYVFNAAVMANDNLLLTQDEDIIPALAYIGTAMSALGGILVVSSMYKLGITGTYLGDYFGILMKARVTSFPFNVLENPMYNGATMVFLGNALYQNSLLGAMLSLWVFIVYEVSTRYFEGPFTTQIYLDAARSPKQTPKTTELRKRPSEISG